jgi:hypothetical protein
MKYYSYGDRVMAFEDEVHWKHIVSYARFMLDDNSIMIEDLEQCSIEDYVAYIEEEIKQMDNELKKLKQVMCRNYSSIDVEGLYGESYDRSLPL